MVTPLDMFAVLHGEPQWLGCADAIAEAIELIVKHGDGEYFVFSQHTGHKNFYKVLSGKVVPTPSAQIPFQDRVA